MAYDDLQLIPCLAKDLCRPRRYIVVACTMKTVAADLVLLIILIGKSIQIRLLRHGLMKRRVEHCHHRHIRHDLLAGIDADQICRIVERRQIVALLDGFQHLVIDDYGRCKLLAAVHHAVSDRVDLVKRLHYAVIRVCERVDHQFDRHSVIGHRRLDLYFILAGRRMGEHAAIDTDPLAESLREHSFRAAVDQLVFE